MSNRRHPEALSGIPDRTQPRCSTTAQRPARRTVDHDAASPFPGPLSRHLRKQRPAGPTRTYPYQRADPLPRSLSVDHSTPLLSHLRSLAISLEAADDAVADSLAALAGDLGTAVASCRGLQLTITQHGYPVILTAFTPRRPTTRRGTQSSADSGPTDPTRANPTRANPGRANPTQANPG